MSPRVREIGKIEDMNKVRDADPHSANNIAKDLVSVLKEHHGDAEPHHVLQAIAILSINVIINVCESPAHQREMLDHLTVWTEGAARHGFEAAAAFRAELGSRS